jgi:hypothetical protein
MEGFTVFRSSTNCNCKCKLDSEQPSAGVPTLKNKPPLLRNKWTTAQKLYTMHSNDSSSLNTLSGVNKKQAIKQTSEEWH